MASNGRTIEPKERYAELTPKMRAIVDAIAENPDANDSEIAEIATENLDDDSVSRAYVPVVRSKQSTIIEQQTQRKQDEQPREDILGQLTEDKKFQGIQNRPYDDANGIEWTLSKQEVESLIQGNVPEKMQQELVAKLLEKAFD